MELKDFFEGKDEKEIKGKKKELKDLLYNVMTNAGYTSEDMDPESRLTIQDLVTTADVLPYITQTVRRIIMETVEPNLLIIANCFTSLNIGTKDVVEIAAIGALHAGKVSEGEEFPRMNVTQELTGAATKITVAKYGLAIGISKEVISDNQFDVIALWLRAAGAALARCKELQGMKMVNSMGGTSHDNVTPGTSSYGVMTGRNIAGVQNGTYTINDLFDTWAYLSLRGFTPDTMIISPLAWKTFLTDPEMREIVLGGATFAQNRMPLGSANQGWQDPFKGLGLISKGTGTAAGGASPWVTTMNPLNATINIPPRYLPTPFKVLVTHHAPFTSRTGKKDLCDITILDSRRAGILVQKENATTEEDDIFRNQTHEVHIYERYGMGMFDQGKGAKTERNVVIDRNYVFENVNQHSLSTLDYWTTLGTKATV